MSLLVRSYHDFVRRNSEFIGQIESSLNGLLWIAPGRYGDSEIALEAVQSLLSIVSYYHDSILCETPPKDSVMFHHWTVLLNLVTKVEVVAEMIVVNKKQDRWRTVLSIEVLKALLRLLILQRSKADAFIDDDTQPSREKPSQSQNPLQSMLGLPLPALENPEKAEKAQRDCPLQTQLNYLHNMNVTASDIAVGKRSRKPLVFGKDCSNTMVVKKRLTTAKMVRLFAEILYISRPIIYVLAIIKFKRSSWKSWMISLFVDLLASYLCLPISSEKELAEQEKSELSRRKRQLLYYLLRSPCFESFTSKPPRYICNKLANVPLIGKVSGQLIDLLDSVNEYFFYIG
eukprot:TRINITY_DN3517_c0_g1_i2.p1 TRINITY_DN3517_c0_g1~~TRINITY_DN3517_c0_g1_i2.p1  ORF type:complete len:344 (-),score=83.11 TRINITY_DN3517_c0_g1_i2:186-1217(-)